MDQSNQRRSTRLKEQIDVKQKEAQAKAELRTKKIAAALNEIAGTPAGRIALRYIKDISNFGRTKLAGNSESRTIDPMTSTVNAAMETVYLKIRTHLRRENIIKIECNKSED